MRVDLSYDLNNQRRYTTEEAMGILYYIQQEGGIFEGSLTISGEAQEMAQYSITEPPGTFLYNIYLSGAKQIQGMY